MAHPIWDGHVTYCTFTASTTSTSFNIPAQAGAVTFIVPTLTTSAEVAVHGLSPIDKTTWTAVDAYDPAVGTQEPVVILSATYCVVPASALGLGTFRLVAADAQTLTVQVLIDKI
jgi:hypothetical protein